MGAMNALRFSLLIPTLAIAAAVGLGCSGGGRPPAERTATAEAGAHAATATAVITQATPVTGEDLRSLIAAGFEGLTIPYTATLNASFREQDLLLGILNDCVNNRGGDYTPADGDYWPAVLGDCYTVGDALKWLYEYSGRQQFAYANQLAKRYFLQKAAEAAAAGATIPDGYLDQVEAKIFTLAPNRTPIALTPLAP